MQRKIRWGILGCGRIAALLTRDLKKLSDCDVFALASRNMEKAKKFKAWHHLKNARIYNSYKDLVSDPELDVVYIATPHHLHEEHTLLALSNSKNVLCEKPFAINTAQAERMIRTARNNGLFLMDALWTRFLPVLIQVKEYIKNGGIGNIMRVTADFSTMGADLSREGRLLNPAMGGGALLDVGYYTLFLARYIIEKEPIGIDTILHIGETGVDEQNMSLFHYPDTCVAMLSSALRLNGFNSARIDGTAGSILIPEFWKASSALIIHPGKKNKVIRHPQGYHYQIMEVNGCLKHGKTESEMMPHAFTLSLMKTMDRIRKLGGLKYHME